ncbi:homeobox protein 2-like [Ochlerotatus camptorhynchus]|uniref:homeobox protein 2-like n=1 Tax=Ochlerotatus camptorhynchus TaxID=644619 RepID=UPI0031E0F6A5
MTAIATGENHVVGSEPTSDIQTEQIDTSLNSNITNTNANMENNESCATFTSNYYTIPLIASEVCTNQNCDLNVGSTCNYLMSHVPNVQTYTSHNPAIITSSTVQKKRTSESIMEKSENINNRTVLPPPVFDSITNELSTASDKTASATKYRTIGKRYHRTIPRQFAAVDPIINPLKSSRNNIMSSAPSNITFNSETNSKPERLDAAYNGNKRLSCQCPVQHTPMTYLSSHSLGVGQNEVTSTVLSGTQIGQMPTMKKRISIDAVRHVNIPHHAASVQTKPVQASSAHCKGGTLRKNYDNGQIGDKNVYSNSNFSKMQLFLANDKAIVDDQPRVESQPNLKKQNSLPRSATLHDTNISLESIHRNETEQCEHNQNAVMMDTSMHISTIMQQSSSSNDREVHRKSYNSTKSEMCIEPNPELPPKMYKHNTSRLSGAHQKSYYSNSKTHAISKPSSDSSKFSIPNSNAINNYKNANKLRKNNYSKSLPRHVISASHDYAQASRSTTQFNNSLQNSNSCFNTLPKKTNKISTRSSNLLTEVVNKVPSVINIPSQLQPHQRSLVGHYVPVSADSMPTQLTSIISNNRRSQETATRRSSNQNQSRKLLDQMNINEHSMKSEKPLPVLSTYTNCANPKEHFLPNDNSLDDDYLSECENCKSAHGSRYYLEEEEDDVPQETMTLQRKMPENEDPDQQNYYRVSSTLPTNTSRKAPNTKNRETWFTTIPASSSSDEEDMVE